MKNYKEFDKKYIGYSDVAAITITGIRGGELKADIIKFAGDGNYESYIINEAAEIGKHYRLVNTYTNWINIYDDELCTLRVYSNGNPINIYRAGDYGMIIECVDGDFYNFSRKEG